MKQVIHYKTEYLSNEDQELLNQLTQDLDLDVTELNDLINLKSLLEILPELDILLVFASSLNASEVAKLEKILLDFKIEKPLIVIGEYFSARKFTKAFKGASELENIKTFMSDIFFSNKIKADKGSLKAFIPIKFSFVETYKEIPFPVDFFIRIKQSAEDYQYIKKLLKNEKFTPEDIEKFKKFNLEFLYTPRDQYPEFLSFAVKLAFASNKKMNKPSMKNLDFSYHLAANSLSLMGITEENVQLVKQNLNIMEQSLDKDNALAEYFKLMNSNQLSYSYAHSYLISLFMTKVAQAFTWDSKAIKERIIYIAFFHDISLPEDHLARVHSHEELYREHSVEYEFQAKSKIRDTILLPSEIEKINHHAINSSLILDQFPQVPIGVSQVVKEHHGAKNGIGFNDSMSISLQPLSMLFIVVEEFVSKFLDIEKPTANDIQLMINELKQKYSKGNYKKSVEAIEQYLFSLRG